MKDQKNNRSGSHAGDMNENRREQNSSTPNDLPDSKEDEKKLQTEETYMDLPDVKDIPGQEFINAPPAGILGDTTASSADEEGLSVFDRDDSDDLKRTGNDADVAGRKERRWNKPITCQPGMRATCKMHAWTMWIFKTSP